MIYTCHIGPISPERQRCIDRQREVYGDEHVLLTEWPSWFTAPDHPDIRYAKDLLFLYLMLQGHMVMDTDIWPNRKWDDAGNGVWLLNSWERLDYPMGKAVGIKGTNYVQAMIDFYEQSNPKPDFMWQLKWYNQHPDGIRRIPMGIFEHKYITTNKRIEDERKRKEKSGE